LAKFGKAACLPACLPANFWDSSALVPLFFDEPSSGVLRPLVDEDEDVVVWMLTGVELLSLIARLEGTATGLEDLLTGVRRDAIERVRRCHPVTQADTVRQRAERLVSIHSLRAADALQLTAALVAAREQPEAFEFVTLDKTLARAARLEGFLVVGV
jgi:hypothetical protein